MRILAMLCAVLALSGCNLIIPWNDIVAASGDGGTALTDAGTAKSDGGASTADASTPPPDAGSGKSDGGVAIPDGSALPEDAGAGQADAGAADAAGPGQDAAGPGEDAGGPGQDAAGPGQDAAAPVPDAAASGPDAAAPGPDAAAPGPDAAAPGPDAAGPGPDAGPVVTCPTSVTLYAHETLVVEAQAEAGRTFTLGQGSGCVSGGPSLTITPSTPSTTWTVSGFQPAASCKLEVWEGAAVRATVSVDVRPTPAEALRAKVTSPMPIDGGYVYLGTQDDRSGDVLVRLGVDAVLPEVTAAVAATRDIARLRAFLDEDGSNGLSTAVDRVSLPVQAEWPLGGSDWVVLSPLALPAKKADSVAPLYSPLAFADPNVAGRYAVLFTSPSDAYTGTARNASHLLVPLAGGASVNVAYDAPNFAILNNVTQGTNVEVQGCGTGGAPTCKSSLIGRVAAPPPYAGSTKPLEVQIQLDPASLSQPAMLYAFAIKNVEAEPFLALGGHEVTSSSQAAQQIFLNVPDVPDQVENAYFVGAFVDRNKNGTLDPGEPTNFEGRGPAAIHNALSTPNKVSISLVAGPRVQARAYTFLETDLTTSVTRRSVEVWSLPKSTNSILSSRVVMAGEPLRDLRFAGEGRGMRRGIGITNFPAPDTATVETRLSGACGWSREDLSLTWYAEPPALDGAGLMGPQSQPVFAFKKPITWSPTYYRVQVWPEGDGAFGGERSVDLAPSPTSTAFTIPVPGPLGPPFAPGMYGWRIAAFDDRQNSAAITGRFSVTCPAECASLAVPACGIFTAGGVPCTSTCGTCEAGKICGAGPDPLTCSPSWGEVKVLNQPIKGLAAGNLPGPPVAWIAVDAVAAADFGLWACNPSGCQPEPAFEGAKGAFPSVDESGASVSALRVSMTGSTTVYAQSPFGSAWNDLKAYSYLGASGLDVLNGYGVLTSPTTVYRALDNVTYSAPAGLNISHVALVPDGNAYVVSGPNVLRCDPLVMSCGVDSSVSYTGNVASAFANNGRVAFHVKRAGGGTLIAGPDWQNFSLTEDMAAVWAHLAQPSFEIHAARTLPLGDAACAGSSCACPAFYVSKDGGTTFALEHAAKTFSGTCPGQVVALSGDEQGYVWAVTDTRVYLRR